MTRRLFKCELCGEPEEIDESLGYICDYCKERLWWTKIKRNMLKCISLLRIG